MSPRETFKFAVLEKLASAGLGPAEAVSLVKRASALSEMVEGVYRLGQSGIQTFGPMAAAGLVAAPIVGGAAVGHSIARSRDDDTDVDEARADELMTAYRQLAAEAARRAKAKGLRVPEGVSV